MFQIGAVTVEVQDDYTVTTFPDGRQLHARHSGHADQAETAARLGYSSVEAMNREHDLTHALLAYWLGLPWSPTLRDVVTNTPATEIHYLEEEAVLAIQRFAVAMGVDLLEVARRISRSA
ncbi:hypothetical protein [Microvirga massiliensis]|uniref:hypothetical protein n=1 Tax=Microvirga massiliensis TaxID=1033741 RepID=UPI00062B5FD6|nr:hypothetical protein [Microvirga massiliensis]